MCAWRTDPATALWYVRGGMRRANARAILSESRKGAMLARAISILPLRRQARSLSMAGALLLAACQSEPSNFGNEDIDPAASGKTNIGSLTEVIKQNPGDANAYYARGTGYANGGKYGDAIGDFDTAIKINPSFDKAYYNR